MSDDLEEFHVAPLVEDLQRQLRRASADQQFLRRAQKEIARLEQEIEVLTAIDGIETTPPTWTQPKTKGTGKAILNVVLSDLHLDEVVDPEQMNGKNAYDREIALLRWKRTCELAIRLPRDYMRLDIAGLVLWWLGDNVSGELHDEHRLTNAGQHTLETLDYWIDPLCAGIDLLAEHYHKVRHICRVGNHGRTQVKPPSKNAIRTNYDWALYRQLRRAFRDDSRHSWNIAESLSAKERVGNTVYWAEHGDRFKGNDSIAGPIRPVMRGFDKRLRTDGPFDAIVVGDKHTYGTYNGIIMNGSLVGYSEFSNGHGYPFDVPKQAAWLETPEHGPAFPFAIMPSLPKKEGWG